MAAATAPTIALGVPVEINQIDRQLTKLWREGGEVMTRASLINLAVYSDAPDSLERNTQTVSRVTKDHACRALVIATSSSADDGAVRAWISAHCHVSRAGSKQVCSEQLSFLLPPSCVELLPNIVFSHLDSDLPFYLWWQSELPSVINPQLWSWIDRLIYDSRDWASFETQLQRVEAAHSEANQRMVLCDLNWTRLVFLRLALAQFFDAPAGNQQLAYVSRLEIEFAPGHRSTAILLAGWFAAQLRWTAGPASDGNQLSFTNSSGKSIAVALSEKAGEPIGRCSVFAGKSEFRVIHAPDADLLELVALNGSAERMRQFMPAGCNDPVRLVSEELTRGGHRTVYLRAIERVRPLL